MTMADKIVVMQDGRIEQTGTPLELYDTPVNLFVAGFIGSPAMNLIEGTVRAGGVMVEGVGLAAARAGDVSEGSPIVYGIRPEHLELAEDGIPARVTVVEPTGAEMLVYLKFGETPIVAIFRERYELSPGQMVHLRPVAGKEHVFDASTGLRL
jgi:multiple sugar transport system ATP-binding protein